MGPFVILRDEMSSLGLRETPELHSPKQSVCKVIGYIGIYSLEYELRKRNHFFDDRLCDISEKVVRIRLFV